MHIPIDPQDVSPYLYLESIYLALYAQRGGVLALLVQQVEQRRGLLADEVEAAAVVDVLDVVPDDALGPVLLLGGGGGHTTGGEGDFGSVRTRGSSEGRVEAHLKRSINGSWKRARNTDT